MNLIIIKKSVRGSMGTYLWVVNLLLYHWENIWFVIDSNLLNSVLVNFPCAVCWRSEKNLKSRWLWPCTMLVFGISLHQLGSLVVPYCRVGLFNACTCFLRRMSLLAAGYRFQHSLSLYSYGFTYLLYIIFFFPPFWYSRVYNPCEFYD